MDGRPLSRWGYIGIGAVGGLAIVLVPMSIFGPPIYGNPLRLVVMSVAAALAMAWNVTFQAQAFRKLDEFAQNASKFAWYWGGSIGLAASLPIFAFAAWGGLHWLAPSIPSGTNILRALLVGYMLPVFAQLAGFLLAWVYWYASKR
jgi:drug/metabolite transporter (DMT)-like permease